MKRLILFLFIFLVACIPQKSQPKEAEIQPANAREVAALQGQPLRCEEFSGRIAGNRVELRCIETSATATATPTLQLTATATNTAGPQTDTPIPTDTATATPTNTPTAVSTATTEPTIPPTPTPFGPIVQFPAAPLCPDTGEAHDNNLFHTLWDGVRGCHYDHEHGEFPFGPEVAAAFPSFDLYELLGRVGVGHTNPSGPTENTDKHPGFKWQAQPQTPMGCVTGFEDAQYGVSAAVIQYHAFGDYSIEMDGAIHSTAALIRQCLPGSNDFGYIYTVQFQQYGQRVTPYQGFIIPYPDTPQPPYASPRGPYFTVDCVGAGLPGCRDSLAFILLRNLNANSIWTSKPTGNGERPQTSILFRLLFRVRDTYQVFDSTELSFPFNFPWLCSLDGGATYAPLPGCRYNNSTTRVHEVAGTVPAVWDNLAGFDTNPAVGRVTAEGFTDAFGTLDLSCTEVGPTCFPLKLVDAYVGTWGGELSPFKVSNPDAVSNPERDQHFCNGQPCAETAAGAVSSGWISSAN